MNSPNFHFFEIIQAPPTTPASHISTSTANNGAPPAAPAVGRVSPRRSALPAAAAASVVAPRAPTTAAVSLREMSYDEKQQLSQVINDLKNKELERVVEIIQTMEPQYADAPEEIEIDFETLRPATLDALDKYIHGELGVPRTVPLTLVGVVH